MEPAHQVVSKIPSSVSRGRLSSGLPRPTSLQTAPNEHQQWTKWLGKPVTVSEAKRGTLLFYGKTHFAEGFFCGVALDEAEGKHDGCVNGVRYFTCPPKHGLLAPVTKVRRVCPQEYNATLNVSFTIAQPRHSCTFVLSPPEPDATFRVDASETNSPLDGTFCVANDKDKLYDVAEDDPEESSLGILTASQMVDLSQELYCDIPKTQSCDDINELPEDEVVENISVTYLGGEPANLTFDVSSNNPLCSELVTSTPVRSTPTADDTLQKRKELQNEEILFLDDVACSFKDVTVLGCKEAVSGDEAPREEESADGIAEELDLLNDKIRNKLGELDRVSIEAVMEVIQRQEIYKNRPASTYTVGSADTGYQGDGECDGHSETAGSPCEEVKPLSLCSQETDMGKSGHMSDSDFFTDQGASSELDLDPMKQSASSILSSNMEDLSVGATGTAIAPSSSCALVLVEEDKNNNSSSADGEQTLVEESTASNEVSKNSPLLATRNNKRKEVPSTAARPESAKRSSARKIVLPPPEPVKKIVRTPRKVSKWDAVTSKIAAGLAEEKTKERKTVKSRVDTNLSSARQFGGARKIDSPMEAPSTPQGEQPTEGVIESRIREAVGEISRTNSEIGSTCTFSSTTAKIPSKIAVPKRTLLDRTRVTKGTSTGNADTKRSRPVRTSISCIASQQQQRPKVESTQRNVRGVDLVARRPPPKIPTETPSQSKTPVKSSGRTAAKIEDLTAEVQRLGALCEQRTKELNMVKMQLKHAYCGFDAFAIMVGYLVGELDAFSHPRLLADMKKTREQLTSSLDLLGRYESELDSLKKQHVREMHVLSTDLNSAKNQVESLNDQLVERESVRRLELEEVRASCAGEMREADERYARRLETLQTRHDRQTLELEETKRRHEAAVAELLEQLEERSQSLELQSKQFEETLQRDTDSKMQWIYAKNAKLVAEVDSLKSVMEMKQVEIHSLRKDNMQLKKELEELPLAQKQIENLRARNEDLQALVREKSKSERRLSHEALQMKGMCEKVSRDNCRISMENEELHWKLQQTLDGSWIAYANDHEHSRSMLQADALPSPMLSPCREMDENRPLASSPINFYTLCSAGPQSTASSPGKTPNRTVASAVRQRHRSLGPHEGQCRDVVRGPSEPALYVKARLEYESDLLFSGSREADGSTESSTDSCDPEDVGVPCIAISASAEDPTDLCSPRSQAGEAMVADQGGAWGERSSSSERHRVDLSEDELSCDSE